MRRIFLTIFVIFPLLLSAQIMKGKAVKIADGDTFTLLVNDHEQVRIRIDGIDAPEGIWESSQRIPVWYDMGRRTYCLCHENR